MKFKTNIPALLLAILVFIASNGIAMSEHNCISSNTSKLSLLFSSKCNNEGLDGSCCSKLKTTKKNCCTHKQFFSKLSIEAFVAKPLEIKQFFKGINPLVFTLFNYNFNHSNLEKHYAGLPPPDNVYQIKSILQPSSIKLQTFRC